MSSQFIIIKTIIAGRYFCYSDFTNKEIEVQKVLGHFCGKGAIGSRSVCLALKPTLFHP